MNQEDKARWRVIGTDSDPGLTIIALTREVERLKGELEVARDAYNATRDREGRLASEVDNLRDQLTQAREWLPYQEPKRREELDALRARVAAMEGVVEAARMCRDAIDELAPDLDRSELSDTTVALLDAIDALHPNHVWTQAEIDEAKVHAAEQLERLKPLIEEPS